MSDVGRNRFHSYCHVLCPTLYGVFLLDIVDHFSTQLIITLNYSAIADFHILQVFSSQQLPGNGFQQWLALCFRNKVLFERRISTELFLLQLYSLQFLFTDRVENAVSNIFYANPLPRERVYRVVTWKRLWYTCLSRGHCIVTAIHATILFSIHYSAFEAT
jgi:hypothetical protein